MILGVARFALDESPDIFLQILDRCERLSDSDAW